VGAATLEQYRWLSKNSAQVASKIYKTHQRRINPNSPHSGKHKAMWAADTLRAIVHPKQRQSFDHCGCLNAPCGLDRLNACFRPPIGRVVA
jgi:hypothetical protein